MLEFLTVVIMGALAYAYLVEGMFTACVMCCNVMIAGVITFNYWEPLATLMEPAFAGYGYEDFLSLVVLFALALGGMRTITNLICPSEVVFQTHLQRIGGAVFGLLTGYLVAGFLVCAMQTLPWHRQFMFFSYRADPDTPTLRRFLPPDRVWLATMHRLGDGPFRADGVTFDSKGDFTNRYARQRRYLDEPPKP